MKRKRAIALAAAALAVLCVLLPGRLEQRRKAAAEAQCRQQMADWAADAELRGYVVQQNWPDQRWLGGPDFLPPDWEEWDGAAVPADAQSDRMAARIVESLGPPECGEARQELYPGEGMGQVTLALYTVDGNGMEFSLGADCLRYWHTSRQGGKIYYVSVRIPADAEACRWLYDAVTK